MTIDEREFTWSAFYDKAKSISETHDISKFTYDFGLESACASLDAIMGLKYQGWEGFTKKYRSLYISWNKSKKFSNSLDKLVNLSPVQNMMTKKFRQLNDTQNLTEILTFVYTVRGNMHHAQKDLDNKTPMSSRNRKLVEHSFNVTFEILEQTLQNENMI